MCVLASLGSECSDVGLAVARADSAVGVSELAVPLVHVVAFLARQSFLATSRQQPGRTATGRARRPNTLSSDFSIRARIIF